MAAGPGMSCSSSSSPSSSATTGGVAASAFGSGEACDLRGRFGMRAQQRARRLSFLTTNSSAGREAQQRRQR